MNYEFKLGTNHKDMNIYPYNLMRVLDDHMNADTPLDCLIGLNFIIETTLTERETYVIKNKFGMKKTLEETGSDLGLSIERMRQIEFKALRKLRNPARYRFVIYGLEKELDNMKHFNNLTETHKDAILTSAIKDISKQYKFDKKIVDKLLEAKIIYYIDLYKILINNINNPMNLLQIEGIGEKSAIKIIDLFNQILGFNFSLH